MVGRMPNVVGARGAGMSRAAPTLSSRVARRGQALAAKPAVLGVSRKTLVTVQAKGKLVS